MLFIQIGCDPVIKFRPNEFYLAAIYLHPVLELPDETNRDLFISRIVGARCALCFFTGDLVDKLLPSSKKRAEALMQDIDAITFHRQIEGLPNLATIQNAIRKFEVMLDEELNAAPIFCLEPVGNLSTDRLLDGAHKGYAPAVSAILEQICRDEIDESGRCLAHERATASGFHILRAVELTVRQYLLSIPDFIMPALNRQNWGEYIKLLKDNGASRGAVDNLQNLKDNFRNPLMHPNDSLQLTESINLFCLSQGMIETLVADMKARGLI